MITTNHPLGEALKDIETFKLKLADYFKDKDVFPIKIKLNLEVHFLVEFQCLVEI